MAINFKVPDKYEIVVSYTWQKFTHRGMDGHLFEVLDYYFFLSEYYKTCIFIGDELTLEFILNIVKTKYNVNIDKLTQDIYFCYSPKLFMANKQTVIIVDGHVQNIYDAGGFIYYKNLISFRCGRKYLFTALENKDNTYLLQDNRIYNIFDNIQTINYIKKVNFNVLKKIDTLGDAAFLYITPNCREMTTSEVEAIKQLYNYDKYIVCNGKPIDNLFEKIKAYIYTPVLCKGSMDNETFDCSPRLIVECAWYGIKVHYYNITYNDIGLECRKADIKNLNSLALDKSDPLLTLLKDIQ